ncbi:MAG: hypothetical protein HZA64_04160 [Rhodocyclales bacterium]|nr:hypothetical protein [Rhodocyclales bacterium]
MRQIKNPDPEDLNCAPQLAVLATLDAVLDVAVSALMSAHQELIADARPSHTDPHASLIWIGSAIIGEARLLQSTLEMYHDALNVVCDAATDDMKNDAVVLDL